MFFNYNLYAFVHLIIGALIMCEGIFIFIQNKRSLTNRAYLINCFFPAIWLTGVGAILISQEKEVALLWARRYCHFGIIFIPAAVYLFSLAWRRLILKDLLPGKTGKVRQLFCEKKILIFIFIISLIFYYFSFFSDKFLKSMWEYPWGFYPRAGLIYIFFIGWFFIIYLLALENFVSAYRQASSPLKKKQAKLMIITFAIAVVGALDFLPKFGVALPLVGFVPTFIFISLVGYGVIRYKSMDVETVLHKTVAWFFTNLILVIPFVLILYFFRFWYYRFQDRNFLLFLVFLGIAFLFFVRALHAKIDHFFQRRRYGLEEIANQFTEDLIHLKGITSLSLRIKDVIKDTLYSQQVNLFIYDSRRDRYVSTGTSQVSQKELQMESTFLQWLIKSNRIIYKDLVEIDPFYAEVKGKLKKYFDWTKAAVIVPLILGQELVGLVTLSRKATFKRYTAFDFHFLTILKNQSAIAISNSLLYESMEYQVKRRTEELIETQKQLIQAEKMATVGTLAGGVAHEINNPLTAILTNVQFMLKFPDSVDEESLKLMEEATKRCRNIIQKLMLYARKPSEKRQVEQIDLAQIVKDAVGLLAYQFKQENVEIKFDFHKQNYFIAGNRNEIEQVITNLLLNGKDAIKKTKKEGKIEIFLAKNKDNFKIKVKDQGIGISNENIAKIFDPFFTTKEIGKGTGLGLSICQSIITKHQGRLQVESKPGQGAVFTVILPRPGF